MREPSKNRLPRNTDEWNARLDGIAGTYIADILRVRNAASGEWMRSAPIIVRLETCDVVVDPSNDCKPSLRIGTLDTDAPVAFHREAHTHAEQPDDSQLSSDFALGAQWESYRALSSVMGSQVKRLALHEHASSLTLDIHTGSGECIRIISEADACTIETVQKPEYNTASTTHVGGKASPARPEHARSWLPPVRFHDPSEVVPVLAS
ncbi:hypothetical protein [Raoultibacter phocaeensis]|uniref:hypothetical protein n=1 Tax=Raoultibacter phocaeensis TaxID=2479841 RepID=UPI00111A3529|nr:hypothetical protein [Raoultibacter phocaeensis]